jgi:hypothetical protein
VQGIEEALMLMPAVAGRVRSQVPEEDDLMNASTATNEHGPREGVSLGVWRTAVFGGIGVLYLVSLAVPAVREALARVFLYFPQ